MNDSEAYEFYADPANQVPTGPGRKPKRPAQKLTSMNSVRFTQEVIEQVKHLATAEGVTVGAWIRAAVARESERQRRAWLDEHRGELEVVPGSGRMVAPRSIPSSLPIRSRTTFACPHLSIGNVTSAACGTCGPLVAVGSAA